MQNIPVKSSWKSATPYQSVPFIVESKPDTVVGMKSKRKEAPTSEVIIAVLKRCRCESRPFVAYVSVAYMKPSVSRRTFDRIF
jgi:hypothetical protein